MIRNPALSYLPPSQVLLLTPGIQSLCYPPIVDTLCELYQSHLPHPTPYLSPTVHPTINPQTLRRSPPTIALTPQCTISITATPDTHLHTTRYSGFFYPQPLLFQLCLSALKAIYYCPETTKVHMSTMPIHQKLAAVMVHRQIDNQQLHELTGLHMATISSLAPMYLSILLSNLLKNL